MGHKIRVLAKLLWFNGFTIWGVDALIVIKGRGDNSCHLLPNCDACISHHLINFATNWMDLNPLHFI